MESDGKLIEEMAPSVLRVLENRHFFQLLDDQMCPENPILPRVVCQGTLATSTATLATCNFDESEIEDIVAVLQARGGFCDCEILYNVAEESRLKSEYWKAVASKRRPLHGHGANEKALRVWMAVEKDDVGYPESQDWEDLWGQPTSQGRVVIDSVPFFAKGIARRDQATVAISGNGLLTVNAIAERSGHSTFRIWLAEGSARSSVRQLIGELQGLGAVVEVTLDRLLAVDAAPEHEAEVWNYLQDGVQTSRWELQVGYSPD